MSEQTRAPDADGLLRRAAESMRRTRHVLEEEQFFNLIDVETEATIVRALGEDWVAWAGGKDVIR